MKKQSRKNKSSLILAVIFGLFFIAVSLSTYVVWTPISLLVWSETDQPGDLKALYLCDEKFPSYLNPFQKPTYTYCFYDSDKRITENADLFAFPNHTNHMKMTTEGESLAKYYQYGIDGLSKRRNDMGVGYLNTFYFMFHYALLAAFIFFAFRAYKSKK